MTKISRGDLNSKHEKLLKDVGHIECCDGWNDMLDELFDKLTPLIEKRNKDSYFECRILQVKEKYGSLRVYMSLETDEMSRLIEEAEEKSATTCELCGNEGGLRIRNGWYMTHCNECHGEKDESN